MRRDPLRRRAAGTEARDPAASSGRQGGGDLAARESGARRTITWPVLRSGRGGNWSRRAPLPRRAGVYEQSVASVPTISLRRLELGEESSTMFATTERGHGPTALHRGPCGAGCGTPYSVRQQRHRGSCRWSVGCEHSPHATKRRSPLTTEPAICVTVASHPSPPRLPPALPGRPPPPPPPPSSVGQNTSSTGACSATRHKSLGRTDGHPKPRHLRTGIR